MLYLKICIMWLIMKDNNIKKIKQYYVSNCNLQKLIIITK